MLSYYMLRFFFFKQKTAYEMRISDWSSDVCSSDLPPFTIVGKVGPGNCAAVEALYAGIDAPLYVTSAGVAESLKYACNTYHAIKIAFANELGALITALCIDAREPLPILREDPQLQPSPAYLRPCFTTGGPCLPTNLP